VSSVLTLRKPVLKLVTCLLTEGCLDGVDKLVELGRFKSRSEALRIAIGEMMNEEMRYTKAKKTIREMPIALAVTQNTRERSRASFEPWTNKNLDI